MTMMMKMKYMILLVVAMLCAVNALAADKLKENENRNVKTVIIENKVVKVVGDSTKHDTISEKVVDQIIGQKIEDQRVIVGKDTVNIIIPEKNYGRYDRGLFNYLFIPRKHWMFGVSASWGEFSADDLRLLSDLKDLDVKCSVFSVNPYAAWFFRHNECVGLRFTYSRTSLDLNNLSVDFDDDINFTLKDVLFHDQSYSGAAFYRHYIGLDNSRRFAVFNEVSLALAGGHGRFLRSYNDVPRDTKSDKFDMRLNFSPGLCAFMQENISFDVSFGVFGWYITHTTQTTNGTDEGTRNTSGANFKFNIFNINFGMAIHI